MPATKLADRQLFTAPGGGVWTTVKKTANQVKTSNTTLADDTALFADLAASTTYRVFLMVFITTANATMDYKFSINYTGTTTSIYSKRRHMNPGVAAGTDNETVTLASAAIGSTAITATTSGLCTLELDMIITTNASGRLSFQWAQNTSDAGALTVLKGSYLEYASF